MIADLYLPYFPVMINESQINKPEHKLDAGLSSLDMKLDYMGTSICMMQLSDLAMTFNDEWIVNPRGGAQTPTAIPIATNRCVCAQCYSDTVN